MQQALAELSAAPPHERPNRRYPLPEFRAYCEGYDWALVIAVQVLELAYDRWKLARRTRRAALQDVRGKTGVAS